MVCLHEAYLKCPVFCSYSFVVTTTEKHFIKSCCCQNASFITFLNKECLLLVILTSGSYTRSQISFTTHILVTLPKNITKKEFEMELLHRVVKFRMLPPVFRVVGRENPRCGKDLLFVAFKHIYGNPQQDDHSLKPLEIQRSSGMLAHFKKGNEDTHI